MFTAALRACAYVFWVCQPGAYMGPGVAGADLGYQAAHQARRAFEFRMTRACWKDFEICDGGEPGLSKASASKPSRHKGSIRLKRQSSKRDMYH